MTMSQNWRNIVFELKLSKTIFYVKNPNSLKITKSLELLIGKHGRCVCCCFGCTLFCWFLVRFVFVRFFFRFLRYIVVCACKARNKRFLYLSAAIYLTVYLFAWFFSSNTQKWHVLVFICIHSMRFASLQLHVCIDCRLCLLFGVYV